MSAGPPTLPELRDDAWRPTVAWRAAFVIALGVALLQATWILSLPFQLDDYFLLRDPWIGFRSHAVHAELDLPPFMCRIPMWVLWGVTAPLAGDPLSPVAFHVVGLLLHGLTAALVARTLSRVATRPAALFAGVAVGVAGGALQAVSWTAAWSSLTYTLFALGTLECVVAARCDTTRGRRLALRVGAAACVALALLSKAPAIVVPAVVGALLLGSALDASRRRFLAPELVVLAVGTLVGWSVRRWFLGVGELGYFERATPSLAEALARVPRGLAGLGQALVPWNADPLVHELAPWTARLTGRAVPGPWLAALVFGVPTLTGLLLAERKRVALLLVATVPAILPLAMLYEGAANNVAGRSAYLPLPLALAAWTLACLALRARWRLVGSGALALGALVLLDGTLHVARTELAMGAHVRRVTTLCGYLAQEDSNAVVAALVGDGGFAGIPALGEHVAIATRPPFTDGPGLEVVARRSESELVEAWRRGAFPWDRGAALMDARVGAPASQGPLRGAAEAATLELGPPTPLVRDGAASAEFGWRFPAPRSRHALQAVVVRGTPDSLRLWFEDASLGAPLAMDEGALSANEARLEWPAALDELFGAAVLGVVCSTSNEPRIETLALLGETLGSAAPLLLPAGGRIELRADAPPRFACAPTSTPLPVMDALGADAGPFLRVEFELRDAGGRRTSLFVDAVDPSSGVPLDHVHLERDGPLHPPSSMPWDALVTEHLLPLLRDDRYRALSFESWVTVRARGSALVLARSPVVRGRFVDPEPTP